MESMGAHAAVAQAVCAVSILALQVWPDQQHPEFQAALYGGGGRAHQLGHSLSCLLCQPCHRGRLAVAYTLQLLAPWSAQAGICPLCLQSHHSNVCIRTSKGGSSWPLFTPQGVSCALGQQ